MAENRRAGTLHITIGGVRRDARGEFTYNIGAPKRTAMQNEAHETIGYMSEGQTPSIEGAITDQSDLVLSDLVNLDDETITLEMANGKVFTLHNAWFAGDGNVTTRESNIELRFEGRTAEETNAGSTGSGGARAPGISIPDELNPFSLI